MSSAAANGSFYQKGRHLILVSARLLSNMSGGPSSKLVHAAASPKSSTSVIPPKVLSPVPNWSGMTRYPVHQAQNFYRSMKYRFGLENPMTKHNKKKIVYLGTGWGAIRFIPNINTSKYDLVLVSPRNFFVFTPLLPSVCTGSLNPKSCVEPIRKFTRRGGKKVIDYLQATAQHVDFEKNKVHLDSVTGKFAIDYDYLVIGVGAQVNTFGIPGVEDNCFFLKESEDGMDIRRQLILNFEMANLPTTPEEEKRRLLHFVVVGGGPSGVEVAAEIGDFVKEDVSKYFPGLMDKIRVSVVEMLPNLLPTFGAEISDFTLRNFEKMSVDSYLRTRVTKVNKDSIQLVDKEGKQEVLPCGFVLWASGVGQVPFSKTIMATLPEQKGNCPAVMRVDQHLMLRGTPHKNVFALGDCSFLTPDKLSDHVDELFEAAEKSSEGVSSDWLKKNKELLYRFPQLRRGKNVCWDEDHKDQSKAEFAELLDKIDKGYKPPVPTAQNAGQEARWLSSVFNDFNPSENTEQLPTFTEVNKGALAYIGEGESVALTPWFSLTGGIHSTLFWKAVYWSMQMSPHNKAMLLVDWIRLMLCGRDLSCERHGAGKFLRAPPSPSDSAIKCVDGLYQSSKSN